MQIPEKLLASLDGVKGYDRAAFVAVHQSGEQVTSVRINPEKIGMAAADPLQLPPGIFPEPIQLSPVPWSSYGYYLSARPSFTFDPLLHAGVYYVQEASSMFLEQALQQSINITSSLRVLDLCASPGGKSTLLQSLITKDSLLVSNEVIKSRAAVLEENMVKWGAPNTVVTNNDPAHFARLENYFDIMLIDAPCTGSGLFRRDATAIQEWTESNVQLCSQRQQRIIADAWPALKKDGILIYATCSYSPAEDEALLEWICNSYSVDSIRLQTVPDWHIIETVTGRVPAYGYRFFPDKLKGEGFFIAVLQKKEGGAFNMPKPGKNKPEKPNKAEEQLARLWLKPGADAVLFKQHEQVIAFPTALEKEIPVLQSALYIKKAGISVGKPVGGSLLPDHALAVSGWAAQGIPQIALSRMQAIQYLQKADLQLEQAPNGWCLVGYEGHALGWIKALPSRLNNYYPKEWRIIKPRE